MRVFLTGGTGFIGQPLTKALLSRGWQVNVLVRNVDSPQGRALNKMGVQCVVGDVTDRESLRAGMSGAELVIHNAGHYEYGVDAAGRKRMQAVNVTGTENVLSLALELDIPRSVYVSSTLAFGDTGPHLRDETFERQVSCRTWYEQTKTDAHVIAQQYQQRGLPLIITCPNGVIGPNDHSPNGYFLRLYINKLMPPMAWSPGVIISWVEVHDLAEGIALAAEKGRLGETYIFAGEAISFREQLDYWARKPGALKVKFWLPSGMAAAFFWPLEPLQRLAGLPAFISRETVAAAAGNFYFSSEKAQKELGWRHCSAEEMWSNTIDAEIELQAKRQKRDLMSRLKPLALDS